MKRVAVIFYAPPSKEEIDKGFSNVSTGMGSTEGEYHIELDDSVQPAIHPPKGMRLFTLQGPLPRLKSTALKLKKNFLQLCLAARDLTIMCIGSLWLQS